MEFDDKFFMHERAGRWLSRLANCLFVAGGLAALPCVAADVEAVHVFKGAHGGGVRPTGALLQASDGNLWGTTSSGGDSKDGVVFRLSLEGDYQTMARVPLSVGRGFVGDLVQTDDGTLWGVTTNGGNHDAGSIVAIGLDGSTSLVYSFDPSGWGGYPTGGLIKGSDGNLYGLIPDIYDGTLPAAVYRIEPSTRSWSILATLPRRCSEYNGRLVEGSDGALYAMRSGEWSCIARVTTNGNARMFHDFRKGEPGLQGLVAGSDGNLYASAWTFSTQGFCSSLIRMTMDGASKTVRSFPCPTLYDYPLPGLMQGADGLLHGSAVHKDKKNNIFYTVWSSALDGSDYVETRMGKYAGQGAGVMIQASDGAFYATAPGGKYGKGTIVRYTP